MNRTATLQFQTFALNVHTPDETATLVASGCGCEETLRVADFAVDTESPAGPLTWSGVLVVENELTGDGRMIESNALRWENLPIPLRHAAVDNGGHDGAMVVGRILTMERREDGKIFATGDFDGDSREGREAARQVGKGYTRGVSVDLDSVSFEIRVAKEILDEQQQMMEDGPAGAAEDNPVDSEGRVTVIAMDADDEVMVTTDARVRAATIVAIPAFAGASIDLDVETPAEEEDTEAAPNFARMEPAEDVPDDAVCAYEGCDRTPTQVVYENDEPTEDEVGVLYCEEHAQEVLAEMNGDEDEEPDDDGEEVAALVAGGFPMNPPAAWFADPQFSGPTPLTITEDGQVYGHLAVWGTCHTAYTGQCVEPPHSPSDYAYFRTGAVITAEGQEVPVGSITLDTMHAGRSLTAADTLAHYEHTGKATCDVAAGEDVFGIWLAGALRPGLPDEKVRALRASPISGDWRRIGGSLELVAALAVNSPGFPVPRPQGLVASGAMQSLVASGILAPAEKPVGAATATVDVLSAVDPEKLASAVADEMERRDRRRQAKQMAARIRANRAEALARRAGVR